ncbi:MAG: SDR family NAD(P)-dependent oxidoreductase [Myxococcota bacterium]
MKGGASGTGADAPRTAVVTGASSGIGVAIAETMARLGWRVGVGARREDRLAEVGAKLRDAGGGAFCQRLDAADPRSVAAFFDAAEKEFGAIDVAVANAGSCIPGLAHELTPEDLRTEVTTNLLGPMYVAQRALPGMIERGRGDLVFISSDVARAPRTFQAGYSAAKAGVESFARVLALELEGTGVRVATIRMGPTRSEFGRDWPPDLLRRMLASWKHFGLQRNLAVLAPEIVANAVVGAVTAPRGASTAIVELQPEGPTET